MLPTIDEVVLDFGVGGRFAKRVEIVKLFYETPRLRYSYLNISSVSLHGHDLKIGGDFLLGNRGNSSYFH